MLAFKLVSLGTPTSRVNACDMHVEFDLVANAEATASCRDEVPEPGVSLASASQASGRMAVKLDRNFV